MGYLITEIEKQRILGMHKTATANHYLKEQEQTIEDKRKILQRSYQQAGTRPDFVKTITDIKNKKDFEYLLKSDETSRWPGLIKVLNHELTGFGNYTPEDAKSLESIRDHMKSVGIIIDFKTQEKNNRITPVKNSVKLGSYAAQPKNQLTQPKDQQAQPKKLSYTRGSSVREIQEFLNKMGYNVGKVDGILGPKTLQGMTSFINAVKKSQTRQGGKVQQIGQRQTGVQSQTT